MSQLTRLLKHLPLTILLTACGSGAAQSQYYSTRARPARSESGGSAMERAPDVAMSREQNDRPRDTRLAQTAPGTTQQQPQPQTQSLQTRTTSAKRMLVYIAQLDVVVNQTNESIGQAISIATSVEGYMASRSDTEVVLRVPSPRFDEVMTKLERLGDVSHRNVQVDDVGERYHDLEVQLTSLRAVRDRLQELLRRSGSMTDALAVERELQRVGMEIDRIEGQLRYLADQALFSTITLRLFPRPSTGEIQPTTYGSPQLVLPYGWLNELGLPTLLETR